ncbi:hypothetical protein BST81_11730, partial [Leptolyngbya sp. 'hensonii']|uniref:diguanylate cyclase domain-containing protein n=1 Tax=Leptolyngbya sp. 'hensonii' TaxID=1922337 RepID=UPI00094F5503
FEVCRRLKANPKLRNIPIIFITASSDTETKVQGLSLGAVDYITKPFQQEEVLARVRVHLRLRFLTEKVKEQAIALKIANQELQRLAHLDGLTQLANRRRFDEYFELEWRRSMRSDAPLALILCDIDYFKQYNDLYGHQAGDTCLKQVAATVQEMVKRSADLVARYGGEEFAVILPNTDSAGAFHIAETIRLGVQHLAIPHARSSVSPWVTLSLGISSCIPSSDISPAALIQAADKGLYKAKQKNRNNSCVRLLSTDVLSGDFGPYRLSSSSVSI